LPGWMQTKNLPLGFQSSTSRHGGTD